MRHERIRALVPARAGLPEWARTRILLRRAARVLFAFQSSTRSAGSLQRAILMAQAFGAELHALYVSAPELAPGPAGSLLGAAGCLQRADASSAEFIRQWLSLQLGSQGDAGALCVRAGEFTEQVAAHAQAIDCSMVIVPGLHVAGDEVSALAHAARLPVLVVRERAAGDAIVAATDLEDRRYPVLRAAAQLSRKLSLPLIALHNVSPVSVLNAMDLVLSEPRRSARTLIELERRRLQQAVSDLEGSATPLMAEEVDPVEAILREARGGGVDLVAVGARQETWWGRWLRRSVNARVVELAPCSVLVVPIDQAEQPRHEPLAWVRGDA